MGSVEDAGEARRLGFEAHARYKVWGTDASRVPLGAVGVVQLGCLPGKGAGSGYVLYHRGKL